MGQVVNKVTVPLLQSCDSVSKLINRRGSKRKRELSRSDSNEDVNNQCDCESPKKKRLLTTTKYIYQALFKEQRNSDITVMALHKIWHLHKVYLSQSPYFHSMFNGSWKESEQKVVHIKILDPNITTESLDAVFGSMYSDEIEVETKSVVSVLATATLFHLDSIIDKCMEVMSEHVNEDTVVQYYEAAGRYGCMQVRKTTFHWLEINLLCMHTRNFALVRSINTELMTDLIKSRNLYVMQTEFSLYTLLRTWMFLRIFPNYDPEDPVQNHQKSIKCTNSDKSEQQQEDEMPKDSVMQLFYRARENQSCFLTTSQGQPFLKVFKALRTQYLTNHCMDLNFLIKDNIVPREWINNHIFHHWNYILRVDHMSEDGPKHVDEKVFYDNCMRCGRVLLEPGYQKWRWTGFNFGLDLVVMSDTYVISIRRHHRHEHERLLSLQPKRNFLIRASVTSINLQRQPIHTQTTEIEYKCLDKNEDALLMMLDAKLKHPLLISISLLTSAAMDLSIKDAPLRDCSTDYAVPISEISGDVQRSDELSDDSHSTTDDSAVYLLSETRRFSDTLTTTTSNSSRASSAISS